MTGISTGIGLVSGIDIESLIDQLIAIEAAPIQNLENRSNKIDAQKAAFSEIVANLLSIKNLSLPFTESSLFHKFQAASSNSGVATATASAGASVGSVSFRVHSLVGTHSVVSKGYADKATTPIGTGSLSFEVGNGMVNPGNDLDLLNGGSGVERGKIKITDRSGASAEVDLTTAVTVQDVLDAINGAGLNVAASVTSLPEEGATGDRIVLNDGTAAEQITSNLIVEEVAGGTTAQSLGIAANAAESRIDGGDLVQLTETLPLSILNDGNGVGKAIAGADIKFTVSGFDTSEFTVSLSDNLTTSTPLALLNSGAGVREGTIRITDRLGQSADIAIDPEGTVGDVINAINSQGLAVDAFTVNSHISLTDTSGLGSDVENELTIEDVDGFAASDLGLAGSAAGNLTGKDVYRVNTVGDVVRVINYAYAGSTGAGLADFARISDDGNGLTFQALGLGEEVTVSAITNSNGVASTAAVDLGLIDAVDETATFSAEPLETRRLISGLNTVLLRTLNGGKGIEELGSLVLTDSSGQTTPAPIDVSQAESLQDVIDLINAAPTGLVASVNSSGNGITIKDTAGGQSGVLIQDATGTLATDLGIAGSFDPGQTEFKSGNLQLQYVTRRTLLEDYNGGKGVTPGSMRITDANGQSSTVLLAANAKNIGQVIDAINTGTPAHVTARINDNGDGILIEDSSGGSLPLKIENMAGSTVASDLLIAGEAALNENFIDGSLEVTVDIAATDTLEDVVEKINASGGAFSASIFNDGGSFNPYSLTVTSSVSGAGGQLSIDSSGVDFGFDTLTQAKDAVVTLGGGTLITSGTNTLSEAIAGVTIDLLAASDEEITVTVSKDVDSTVDSVQAFVDAFNKTQETIDSRTSFDAETFEQGILFGDPTVNTVRSRLHRTLLNPVEGAPDVLNRMFQVGLKIGANNRLEFDETKFRDVLEANPEAVEELFTLDETGFGDLVQDTVDGLANEFDGTITLKNNLLTDRQELLADQIERLGELLEAKRARLEAQFLAMESALAGLQDQQSALASLSGLLS